MSKGSFRRALIEADRELARVPFVGERDVRAIVDRRRVPWRLPALALASALVVLFVMRSREVSEPRSEVLALDMPGFGHVAGDRDARVVRISGGIHVVSGRVDVDVAHRPRGTAPALVRVSHGTIAVLGTRFTIEQSEHGGRVVLHEGKIRFDGEGRSIVLAPGESLSWPLAPPAPVVAPPPPVREIERPIARVTKIEPTKRETTSEPTIPTAPTADAPPALDIDQLLAELANLRARRRFIDAARLLENALATALPSTTHERLSYELGDIRTYQLTDRERACAHWQAHRDRFPHGRYTDEVAAAVRRLACQETP